MDELPQLINVLLGHMSLVGPRPPLPSEVESYDECHFSRFDVKPGITGPWQAGGRNGITDFETVVRMEREYVRRWSVMEDIRILLRTIPAVLRGSGAH
jgi:lipopolysaccharide/colanic/teichoic acid biosynthesis glycosyltransferase